MEENKKICAVYARVSTDMQGESLVNQVEYAKAYIQRLGEEFEVSERYIYKDEDESGYYTRFIDRPAMRKALEDAKQREFNLIVFKEISRVSRDQSEHREIITRFEQNGIRVIAINDNLDTNKPETVTMLGIHGFLAEMESTKISSRVSSAKKSLARRGLWVGEAPIGYKVNKNTKHLQIDEDYANIPRLIFDLYTKNGYGTFAIAEYLNEHSLLTKNRRFWSRVTVNRVLNNPAYVGDLVYGKTRNKLKRQYLDSGEYVKKKTKDEIKETEWIVIQDSHPALISRDVFENAQNLIKKRAKQHLKRVKHPLTGILKCGHCGANMICQKQRMESKSGPKEYRYYTCSTRFRFGKSMCKQSNVKASEIEEIIRAILINHLESFSNTEIALTLNEDKSSQKRQEYIRKEINRNELALKRLYLDTALSEERFLRLKIEFESKIGELERELKISEQEKQKMMAKQELKLKISDFLSELKKVDQNDLNRLRVIFYQLLQGVTIKDNEVKEVIFLFDF